MTTQSTVIPFTGFYGNDYGQNVVYDDYKNYKLAFCKAYVDAFAREFVDYWGFELRIEFDELDSPREYNFANDRIFAKIDSRDVQRLFDEVSDRAMSDVAKELFTSRDGFASHYSPDWQNDWSPDPRTWDHNQVYCLLMAYLHEANVTEYEFEQGLYETANLYELEGQFETYEPEN